MTRSRATALGTGAIAMWSLLAVLTVFTSPVPPLQLSAMSFGIGGIVGLLWVLRSGGLAALAGVSWKVSAFGTAGLFGYHALYFSALRLAPAAQAGLIAYLWPLLIVLASGLLPGERLRAGHVFGALLGFSGAALVLLSPGAGVSRSHLVGYLLALACAAVWSAYSVLSRRLSEIPTGSVAIFCIASAVLSLAAHILFETPAWPAGSSGWAAVILLGLGPVGLAFFVWDVGMKQGDIQFLGVAAYAAPLLSTLVLVAADLAQPSWTLALAAILISGGALSAARAR